MAIEVRIPTILRAHRRQQDRREGSGATLSALVDDLDNKHPGLKNRLVTEEGKLHRFVNVYVNDEDVRFTGALDTQVKDGDSVTILPAVAGGWPPRRHADGPLRLPSSTPSAAPRWSGCRRCRRPPTSGCGPSSRTTTRRARSRTAPPSR